MHLVGVCSGPLSGPERPREPPGDQPGARKRTRAYPYKVHTPTKGVCMIGASVQLHVEFCYTQTILDTDIHRHSQIYIYIYISVNVPIYICECCTLIRYKGTVYTQLGTSR